MKKHWILLVLLFIMYSTFTTAQEYMERRINLREKNYFLIPKGHKMNIWPVGRWKPSESEPLEAGWMGMSTARLSHGVYTVPQGFQNSPFAADSFVCNTCNYYCLMWKDEAIRTPVTTGLEWHSTDNWDLLSIEARDADRPIVIMVNDQLEQYHNNTGDLRIVYCFHPIDAATPLRPNLNKSRAKLNNIQSVPGREWLKYAWFIHKFENDVYYFYPYYINESDEEVSFKVTATNRLGDSITNIEHLEPHSIECSGPENAFLGWTMEHAIIDKMEFSDFKDRKAYDDLIKMADNLFQKGKYSEAKETYLKASTILNEEQYPMEQIRKINTILENQNKYYKAMDEGNANLKTKRYKSAITNYEAALAAMPNDKAALNKLNLAKNALKKQNDEIENLVAAKKYDAALDRVNRLLKLGADPALQQKKDAITQLIQTETNSIRTKEDEEKQQEEERQRIEGIITNADSLFYKGKWDDAKETYYQLPITSLSNKINSKIKDINKYNELIEQADNKFESTPTNGDLNPVINLYNEALAIKQKYGIYDPYIDNQMQKINNLAKTRFDNYHNERARRQAKLDSLNSKATDVMVDNMFLIINLMLIDLGKDKVSNYQSKGISHLTRLRWGLNMFGCPTLVNREFEKYGAYSGYGTGQQVKKESFGVFSLTAGIEYWPLFGNNFGLGGVLNGEAGMFLYTRLASYEYGLAAYAGFDHFKIYGEYKHGYRGMDINGSQSVSDIWVEGGSCYNYRRITLGPRFEFLADSARDVQLRLDILPIFELPDFRNSGPALPDNANWVTGLRLQLWFRNRLQIYAEALNKYPVDRFIVDRDEGYSLDNDYISSGTMYKLGFERTFDFFGDSEYEQNSNDVREFDNQQNRWILYVLNPGISWVDKDKLRKLENEADLITYTTPMVNPIGIEKEFNITDWSALTIGAGISAFHRYKVRSLPKQSEINDITETDFLQYLIRVPVNARFFTTDKSEHNKYWFNIGASYVYNLHTDIGISTIYSDPEINDDRIDKRYIKNTESLMNPDYYTFIFGFGIDFQVSKTGGLRVGVQFENSLDDITKKQSLYTHNLSVICGIFL